MISFVFSVLFLSTPIFANYYYQINLPTPPTDAITPINYQSLNAIQPAGKYNFLPAPPSAPQHVLTRAPTPLSALHSFVHCLPRPVFGPNLTIYGSSYYEKMRLKSYRSDAAVPLAFAAASKPGDVQLLLFCAQAARIPVCSRSGGHSLSGHSLCPGIVIDVAAIDHVNYIADGIFDVGAGASLGQVAWQLFKYRRWFPIGVFPGIGMAGYTLGGGHGPYEGLMGLAVDHVQQIDIMDRFGRSIVANRTHNTPLFWASLGAGGNQFGVVTSLRISTASSNVFDNAVVFRFKWPKAIAGQLLSMWQLYDEHAGKVWFRVEMYLDRLGEEGIHGFGACYDVQTEDECMHRLNSTSFFNLAGRSTVHWRKAENVLDVEAFLGPGGNWGRKKADDIKSAILDHHLKSSGAANNRMHRSAFLKWATNAPPSAQFWQTWANRCGFPPGDERSLEFIVCEMNLFNNAIDRQIDNSFPYREAYIISHYIVGGGTSAYRRELYDGMKNHLTPYTLGGYVNYGEPELVDAKEYGRHYWGKNLERLQKVKDEFDPLGFFSNTQAIPTTVNAVSSFLEM